MKFDEALNYGIEVEFRILNFIKKKYPKAFKKIGKCSEWDIYVPEKNIYIEVKSDVKSNFTGNILIECEMYNKPSGINITKSDYWIIYDGKFHWFLTQQIKKCINDFKPKLIKIIGNGDTVPKLVYLIKKDILFKYRCQENDI
jgi:hypothetical protein